MKHFFPWFTCAVISLAIVSPSSAEEKITLTAGTSGSWIADWNGAVDRTDFLQWSTDLVTWHYAPIVEYGAGAKSYGFISSTDKFFTRLQHGFTPSTDPEGDDYDQDGLSNGEEVILRDTNPLAWDTDGDGMSDSWELAYSLDPRDNGTIDPNNAPNADPDGDGLTNVEEYLVYSNPLAADSDGDGLSDYAEAITYHTNPTNPDSDGDTLTDFAEIQTHSTDPLNVDTDGDWMHDDWELPNTLNPLNAADGLADADNDGLANQLEYVFIDKGYDPVVANNAAAFPWQDDPDYDGLTTQVEYQTHHTNPRQPDTDEDGLDDGWEIQYGYNAKVNNSTDNNPNNDEDADPDGDGLTNAMESALGTNPNATDTDGDGVSDNDENNNGSNPKDPNDHNPPPNGTVAVNVTFGDHSGSHSEKYRVRMQPVEGDTQVRQRSNRHYGDVQTDTFHLPKGTMYTVTLEHIGTRPNYRGSPKPDFDYTLEIPQVSEASGTIRAIKDPQGIFGIHDESIAFNADGKSANLFVMNFETETVSLKPINRNRRKLGVGESVEVRVTPFLAGTVNWTIINQKDAEIDLPTGHIITFKADTRTNNTTLRATMDTGEFYDILWNVVQPTGEKAKKLEDLSYPSGQQGAGMEIEYTVLPDDVSFYRVQVVEIDKGTSNITGFFVPYEAAQLKHDPNPNWVPLSPENVWYDTAAFFNWGSPPETENPDIWSEGAFQWEIDIRWRVEGEMGNGLLLGTRTQLHTLHDGTGRSTVSKSGVSSTRTP